MFTNANLVSEYNSMITDLKSQESILNAKLKNLKSSK